MGGILGRALSRLKRKVGASSSSSSKSYSKPLRAPRVGARLADVNTQHVALVILVAVVVAPFMEYRGTPGQTVQSGMLSLLAPLGDPASPSFSRAALQAEVDGFFDFFYKKQKNPLMVPKIVTVGEEVFDRTAVLGPLPRRAADVHSVSVSSSTSSPSSSPSVAASATFDTSGANRRAAVLSLALSALVVAWVSAAAAGLGRSAARLVIGPVERVLAALRRDAGAVLDAVDGGGKDKKKEEEELLLLLPLLPTALLALDPLPRRKRTRRGARVPLAEKASEAATEAAAAATTTTTTATASSGCSRPPSPSSRPSWRTSVPPEGCAGTP